MELGALLQAFSLKTVLSYAFVHMLQTITGMSVMHVCLSSSKSHNLACY